MSEHPELLPWFVAGTLEGDEAARIAAHVADCEECRAEIRTLEAVQDEMVRQTPSDHPSPRDLVFWADSYPALDPAERDRIAAHLEGCAACSADLERVTGPAWPTVTRTTAARRKTALAVAAGVMLAVIGGAGLLLTRDSPRISPRSLDVIQLRPSTRSTDEVPALRGTGPWALEIALPSTAPAGGYRIRVESEDGETVVAPIEVVSHEARGGLSIAVLIPGLPEGDIFHLVAQPELESPGAPYVYTIRREAHAAERGELRRLLEDGYPREVVASASRQLEARIGAGRDSEEDAELMEVLIDALSAVGRGRDLRRLELARRAVAVRETGEDAVALAGSLRRLADALAGAGEYEEAFPLLDRAEEALERVADAESSERSLVLLSRSNLMLRDGDRDGALETNARALEILETAYGLDDRHTAAALLQRAVLLRRAGQLAAARPFAQRAHDIRRATLRPGHPDTALALVELGTQDFSAGNFAPGIERLQQALTVLEEALGPRSFKVGITLNNLAGIYFRIGDFAGAASYGQRALAIYRDVLGPEHPRLALMLDNIGLLLFHTGDYSEARSHFEQAIEISRANLGQNDPDMGVSLANLGLVLEALGDSSGAERLLRQSVEVGQKNLGEDHPGLAESLNRLGLLLKDEGRLEEARVPLQRAAEILAEAYGGDHPDTAGYRAELAGLLVDLGEYDAAEGLLEQTLDVLRRKLGGGHPEVGAAMAVQAKLLRVQGDSAGARDLLRKVLAIREDSFDPRHPRVAQTRLALAHIEWSFDEDDTALDGALLAEEIARDHFRDTARGLSERDALRFDATRTSGLDLALTIAVTTRSEDPSMNQRTWDHVIRSRALVLDETADRRRAAAAVDDPELETLSEQLREACDRLARVVLQRPGRETASSYGDRVRRLRRKKDEAERALVNRSRVFRESLERKQLGLDDVRTALPRDAALVAYVAYDRVPRAGVGGVRSYAAFVLQGDSGPVAIDLGSAAAIESDIELWTAWASSDPGNHDLDPEPHRAAGDRLRAAVWDPVAAVTNSPAMVFVVPDGGLHQVNLATLPTGGGRWLIETAPLLHYLSTERDLVRGDSAAGKGQKLLVLGDPAFDREPNRATPSGPDDEEVYRGPPLRCPELRALRFTPLPGARDEARTIEALWRSADHGAASEVIQLHGEGASEANVKRLAPGCDLLHLATHGVSVYESCFQSEPDQGLGNPLVLTGLALAGANLDAGSTDDPAREDGILTADEIAALDLSRVRWAVLSACGTGSGPVFEGEGVLGLRRAFEIAGAGTLILTLWSVEDDATLFWMRELYRARLDGRSTAEAIRGAGLRWIADRKRRGRDPHPFYWGAFVAAGDWR